ncbi:MAG: hypothetical protein P1P79_03800, partial [Lutibacter sp.]|nr:hypothetical protein [Lutibacter sp.]
MKKSRYIVKTYILFFFFWFFLSTVKAQTPPILLPNDTTIVEKATDTTKLKYPFNRFQEGSLFLTDPKQSEIIYDTALGRYMIVEKIGDYYVQYPIFMTQEEYKQYQLKKDMLAYYKSKISATNPKKAGSAEEQKNLLPTYYVKSD